MIFTAFGNYLAYLNVREILALFVHEVRSK